MKSLLRIYTPVKSTGSKKRGVKEQSYLFPIHWRTGRVGLMRIVEITGEGRYVVSRW